LVGLTIQIFARRKGGQAVWSHIDWSKNRTRRRWGWRWREGFNSSTGWSGKTQAYSKRSYRIKRGGRNIRLETKASIRNCNRMGTRKTTTIKGEIYLNPINFGIVVLKPVQAKNDWVANRNNSKGSHFRRCPNTNISKYVMGDQSRHNRTIINSNNRNRNILEMSRNRMTGCKVL
jgi:hypothetical protein